ncbi:MAG TPA: maleylpyruvate isomerase family mycothiol-dependent enzyme [Iamia sp.]|nr:maleylpyruvate isomerase family mycothiol-dependent enzyme [Iamia sp.]
MPASPDPATIRTWVAEARVDLADRLAALPAEAWDADSLCSGWRVRDVVGHLVFLAEGTRPSVFREAFKQAPRTPDRAVARIARREGAAEPGDLVRRLREAGGRGFTPPGFGPTVALGEVLVHGSDVLRPTGGAPRPADERTLLVAESYRRLGFAFGSRRAAKVRFTADDGGWSVGPPDGPAAHGPGEAVLLALAGRPEGVADLAGPGLERLAH